MLEKSDWYHLKLLDGATGDLLARFVHDSASWSKRGFFKIRRFESGGQGWDRTVVLTRLVVLEWMRQLVTMRFWGRLMVGSEGVGWSRDNLFFFSMDF